MHSRLLQSQLLQQFFEAWLTWCTHAQSAQRLHALYMHVTGQVCTHLLQTSRHQHRHQQQHNLTGCHAHMHLAHAASCVWWHAWQHPADSGGFEFQLLTLTVSTAQPAPEGLTMQPAARAYNLCTHELKCFEMLTNNCMVVQHMLMYVACRHVHGRVQPPLLRRM